MRKRGIAIFVAYALLFAVVGLYSFGFVPGTVRKNPDGSYWGTGLVHYRYPSGRIKLEEKYLAGRLRLSRWYRPDGTLIAETEWNHGDGVGYFLRDDGTVRQMMEFKGERAHGRREDD